MNLKTTIALTLVALALTACGDTAKSALNDHQSIRVSSLSLDSVRWDELAAADTAAQVKNNSLIMMR